MRTLSIAVVVLFAGGCTLMFQPDRDDIVVSADGGYDAGSDAGSDGGIDGGFDGGLDAGHDAGCIRTQPIEVSCSDGLDNDCDFVPDCGDADCRADGYCCDVTRGSPWMELISDYNFWRSHGSASSEPAAPDTATNVTFGSTTGQVVHAACAPLAFGMRFEIDFDFDVLASTGDFAAFVLAPVDTPRGGGDMTLLADLALRVAVNGDNQGTATLERAGTVLATTLMNLPIDRTADAQLSLQPSVDDIGRPVLLVSATVAGQELADRVILMPLSDLRRSGVGCTPDGLFIALEGRGGGVSVSSLLQAVTGNCPNPTQFIADAVGPLGEMPILTPGTWRAGGAGEPALLALNGTGTPITTTGLELLVDASEEERSDEFLAVIDFSIGGAVRQPGGWFARESGGSPNLIGPMPESSREPSLATGAPLTRRLIAYAAETSRDRFEIRYARVNAGPTSIPDANLPLLVPGMNEGGMTVACGSLRDPSLVALESDAELLLFFTCRTEGSPDTIGVARLVADASASGYGLQAVQEDLLTRSVGSYGRQGVLSPEIAVTSVTTDAMGDLHHLRIWFLARSAAGRVSVGLAYGEVRPMGLPIVTPYPGNPVLDPEDQVLGGACPLGCAIESLGVAPIEGTSLLWSPMVPPSYLFLVERSRYRADGVDHQLVPIRQPRPSGG